MKKAIRILILISIAGLIFYISSYLIRVKNIPVSDVTVYGPIEYADSLGRQTIDLIEMLKSDDFSINFISPRKIVKKDLSQYVLKTIANDEKDESIGKVLIYEKMLKPTKNEFPTKFILSKFFSWLKGFDRSKQIWYTYSMIETTAIPPKWVEKINQYFDAVLVPDEFLVEVYEKSGVKKPIFVVPLPVDMEHMLDQPLKSKRNEVFTFLNVGSISLRKNHLRLVESFHKAFGNRDEVKLVISARFVKKQAYNDLVNYLQFHKISNIEISKKTIDKSEYLKLLQSADCYINVSTGEGFSIPPREAMALGIPVIISNNTAQRTIAKSNLAVSVESDIEVPDYNDFLKLYSGISFQTDANKIAASMLYVYNNYDELLKKSSNMRQWVKKYHFNEVKKLYHTVVKPNKLIFGKSNIITESYLETNDHSLYNKYKTILIR